MATEEQKLFACFLDTGQNGVTVVGLVEWVRGPGREGGGGKKMSRISRISMKTQQQQKMVISRKRNFVCVRVRVFIVCKSINSIRHFLVATSRSKPSF